MLTATARIEQARRAAGSRPRAAEVRNDLQAKILKCLPLDFLGRTRSILIEPTSFFDN